MAIAKKSDLIGRTIVSVDWRRFKTRPEESSLVDGMDPIITLDNGRRIVIQTQETDIGQYGHKLIISELRNRSSMP